MMRQTLFALACISALTLSGVALSSFAPKNSDEFGKCSYYADSFQGRPTSNGEKYDKNLLTCSHKSLPFGTVIRVTRLDNQKSVVVRVNDRGPFIEGYVVDVSGKAADELDLKKKGSTRVKIEVVEKAQPTTSTSTNASTNFGTTLPASSDVKTTQVIRYQETPAAKPVSYNLASKGSVGSQAAGKTTAASNLYKVDIKKSDKKGYGIQISTLNDADNVLPVIDKLQGQWPGKVLVHVTKDEANDISTYKVIVGPYTDEKTAKAQQKLVSQKGYKKTMIVDLSTM